MKAEIMAVLSVAKRAVKTAASKVERMAAS